MRQSEFFRNLFSMYGAEIDDLLSDSEGKNVLAQRLKEKRENLPSLLPMIRYSPEMVVPAFYDAFTFSEDKKMEMALLSIPEAPHFPTWGSMSTTIQITNWAAPMVTKVLAEEGGDQFMVIAATLEYLRRNEVVSPNPDEVVEEADDDENDSGDLSEEGKEWLSDQGFDKLDT